jgi:DNA/RNA-binding domain of Phe-tRNA-synthetase-like protein
MKISIKPEVFERFNKDLQIAFIKAENVDNKSKSIESKHLLQEVEKLVRLNFHKKQIKNNSFIEPWALAQLEFGGKAHHYHTSVERLLKTVLGGKTVAKADTVDNILRYIALRYLVPVSADDFHKIEGDLTFEVVKSSGKKSPLKALKRGELYYHDAKGILGTQVDYWRNKRTEVSRSSFVNLIHMTALPPVTKDGLKQIAKELASMIEAFCGARTKQFILSRRNRSITI